MRLAAVSIVALSLIAGRCDRSDSQGADGQVRSVSPKTLAKENSKHAAEAIAESKQGTPGGEKVWMQDAREFFDRSANPKNRTFELPWKWSTEFADKAYAAGASKVWVVNINNLELGQNKVHVSDEMVVVLPKGASQRQVIFDAYNAIFAQDAPEEKIIDVGQQYLYVQGG